MEHSCGLSSAEAQATELRVMLQGVRFCFSELNNYLLLMKPVVAAVSFLLKRKVCPCGTWARGALHHGSFGGDSLLLPCQNAARLRYCQIVM